MLEGKAKETVVGTGAFLRGAGVARGHALVARCPRVQAVACGNKVKTHHHSRCHIYSNISFPARTVGSEERTRSIGRQYR